MDDLAILETKPGISLKLKLSIGLILIIGILFTGLNTFNILTHRARLREEALIHNETIARLLASAIIPELASHDIRSERFQSFVRNFLNTSIAASKSRDLAFVVVIDDTGNVIAGRARTYLTIFPGGRAAADETEALALIAKTDNWAGTDMRMNRFPLKVSGDIVGKLLVGTSLTRIKSEAEQDLIINLAALVGALVCLVLYATVALSRMVVKPVTVIADAMRAVQKGDLGREVDLRRKDEIGVLATTYNFMVRG